MTSSNITKKSVTQAINEFLAFLASEHPKINKIVVALSGGKDSIGLLHALSKNANRHTLSAIYIDHGLQAESLQWTSFNEQFCKHLKIEFHAVKVTIDKTESSLEQAARNARYQALSQYIDKQSCLVTAQHQDDQAETVLLQMLRGAGSKGLAAMPYLKPFAQGFHARPLLSVSRETIEGYIADKDLKYIDDPSNCDLRIRRNFLRKEVIPRLKIQWPQVKQSLAKVANNLADSQELLDEIAAQDLLKASEDKRLKVSAVTLLSDKRQTNLLRYWLAQYHLKMPSKVFLAEIKTQLLAASDETDPVIDIEHYQLRRYQDFLYCIQPRQCLMDAEKSWDWLLTQDFAASCEQKIAVKAVLASWPELNGTQVTVRFRKAGDKYYRNQTAHGQSLKNYFQENKIPTWLRESCLLVEHQGKIIFIQQKNQE